MHAYTCTHNITCNVAWTHGMHMHLITAVHGADWCLATYLVVYTPHTTSTHVPTAFISEYVFDEAKHY